MSGRGLSGYIGLIGAVLALAAPLSFSQRLHLIPRLRQGQTFFYHIGFSGLRSMKTESRVATPQLPPEATFNISGLLQVEIVEITPSGFRVKTYYSERDPSVKPSQAPASQSEAAPSSDKMIEVSISRDGSASQIKGLDQLSPQQQFAWNDWLSRFTSSMTFPENGVAAGQKWEAVESETTPSPIAGLSWAKKFQYVRDEPCGLNDQTAKTISQESTPYPRVCAVILVRSTLRQKSSPKNATPEDYKLRNLKTRGAAAGQNETILYVSRSTGLLVRSTEDTQQSMDAIVALADGSNQVHYNLDAKSHSDILLLPDSPRDAN
jgi:hypothetical protein